MNIEQIVAVGRSKIENKRQGDLANITTHKQAKLEALSVKYQKVEKARASLGYVSMIFLSLLFGTIFINDFVKLARCLLIENNKLAFKSVEADKREDNVTNVYVKIDEIDSDQLEARLKRVHVNLLRAVHRPPDIY